MLFMIPYKAMYVNELEKLISARLYAGIHLFIFMKCEYIPPWLRCQFGKQFKLRFFNKSGILSSRAYMFEKQLVSSLVNNILSRLHIAFNSSKNLLSTKNSIV